MESRPSFGRHIAALEHPKSTHHPCLVRASTVSCADAGEGSHFDGGLESQNYARIFTVNEAPGSSNMMHAWFMSKDKPNSRSQDTQFLIPIPGQNKPIPGDILVIYEKLRENT